MLVGLKNLHAKAKAATIVQNLLELPQHFGRFNNSSNSIANQLVTNVFKNTPTMFNGSRGQRPHDISFAASAFAHALKKSPTVDMVSIGFLSCLGTILDEVQNNSHLYPLMDLDRVLLTDCFEVLEKATKDFKDSPLGKDADALINN